MNNSSFLILILLMVVFMIVMSFVGRRQSKKQSDRVNEMISSLTAGDWVRTIGGMYGRVVDVDGEVVVLETADGSEMLFDKRAISTKAEPPFGYNDSQSSTEADTDTGADADAEQAQESAANADAEADRGEANAEATATNTDAVEKRTDTADEQAENKNA